MAAAIEAIIRQGRQSCHEAGGADFESLQPLASHARKVEAVVRYQPIRGNISPTERRPDDCYPPT
jgi:hypothetical protein